MSKENAVFFIEAIDKSQELNKCVVEAQPSLDSWVKIAYDAGFEFTGEEFATVVAETLGRNVSADDAVSEYLAARDQMGSTELSDRALEKVVGAARRFTVTI
jgi:predicted ribosomally synthesized peptide with nif11-like leader